MDLPARAEALARRAHAGQRRDDSQDPYIVHPVRVAARLAARFPADPALTAAAWCHDVLEDCPQITREELIAAIGDEAFAIVSEVTNPSKQHPELPRAERKAMDRAHIAVISAPRPLPQAGRPRRQPPRRLRLSGQGLAGDLRPRVAPARPGIARHRPRTGSRPGAGPGRGGARRGY